VLDELVQTTDGSWITRPPTRCPNGHPLGPNQVLVGSHTIDPNRNYWHNQQKHPGRWPGRSVTDDADSGVTHDATHHMEPPGGIEPPTYSLRVNRSTD
jgi:hypothetical protein